MMPGANGLRLLVVLAALMGACRSPDTHPSGAVSPAPTPSPNSTLVLDDFEGTSTRWQAGRWPFFTDSSDRSASLATEYVTRGTHSLQLSFERTFAPKAIFTLDQDIDLTARNAVALDVFNAEGAAEAIGVAFRSGTARAWQESLSITLKPGANAVRFDLTSANFKTAATRWQHRATLAAPDDIRQIALILYPLKRGHVFVDKLLAIGTPSSAQSTAAPQQSASPGVTIRAAPVEVTQYGKVELDIDTTLNPAPGNPFDPEQITIDALFTAPDGQQVRAPAFYTQDFKRDSREPVWPQTWRARFTPMLEGEWTARVEARVGKALFQSDIVTFTVVPAVARGFVRVNRANPRYLAFDNGEAFLPAGLNLSWWREDALKDYERWFDTLQQNGANVTRLWMSSWAFGIEWNDSGLGNYRLDRAWLLDQVLQMAEQRGIYIILVLLNHGAFNQSINPEWDANPYNAARGGPCQQPEDFMTDATARKLFQQRLRYIAARWGYSPNLLAWEWWNEVDLTPLADPNLLRPWLREMTAYLRSVDPQHHLTSISYADSSDPRILELPELDTLQRHDYSALDPRQSMPKAYDELTTQMPQVPAKPILYTEFGASPYGEAPTRSDPEGIQFHNGLWASLFSGFASTAMYWWWDNYIEPNNYWDHLKGVSALLAGEDISTLSPTTTQVATTTVQASALAGDDRALLWLRNAQYSVDAAEWAYRQALLFGDAQEDTWTYELREQRGITVTLSSLPPGSYQVRWLDTRRGDVLAQNAVRTRRQGLTVTAPPFQRDLAARIIRISD